MRTEVPLNVGMLQALFLGEAQLQQLKFMIFNEIGCRTGIVSRVRMLWRLQLSRSLQAGREDLGNTPTLTRFVPHPHLSEMLTKSLTRCCVRLCTSAAASVEQSALHQSRSSSEQG